MIQQIANSPFTIGFLTGAGVATIWYTLWVYMLCRRHKKLSEENDRLKEALHRWKMAHDLRCD